MSKDFDSSFDSFFSRKLAKGNSKEYTMGSGETSDAAAAMDRIEQKIAEMESRAEATRELSLDAAERNARERESQARVEDELAALKQQAIETRNASATGTAPPSDLPSSALSKIKLVVGEPKKWLPALIKKQSNLPKRLKD